MGEDKAFISLNGKPLFSYSLEVLKHFTGDILISTINDRFTALGYPVIKDEYKGIGPLGGIYSCLKHISHDKALVIPCDMPFVSHTLIDRILKEGKEKDLCIPFDEHDRPVPTLGLYSRHLISIMEKLIQKKQYKLSRLLTLAYSASVPVSNEEAILLKNINTPLELKKAQSMRSGK